MKSRRRILTLLLLITLGWLASCEQPLFTPNQARTPYERYQLLRGQQRPATQENVFGGEEPALRDRLRPLS